MRIAKVIALVVGLGFIGSALAACSNGCCPKTCNPCQSKCNTCERKCNTCQPCAAPCAAPCASPCGVPGAPR